MRNLVVCDNSKDEEKVEMSFGKTHSCMCMQMRVYAKKDFFDIFRRILRFLELFLKEWKTLRREG